MTGGHNKTGKADRTAKNLQLIFRTQVGIHVQNLVAIGSFSKKLQQKVRGPEHSRSQSLI